MPNIIVTDGRTLNPGDLQWQPLETLGTVQVYPHTTPEELLPRIVTADIIIVNKTPIHAPILKELHRLRCICVSATGYNNVDIITAAHQGIPVCNVSGYGTAAVAQHVFALLLEMTNAVARHDASVRAGDWSQQHDFCYTLQPIIELAGKTMGIYGLGRIGQQVARIAQAFGMHVLATHKQPMPKAQPDITFVDLPTLFQKSDVITLHAPLTPDNEGIVNKDLLQQMKPSAYLINTARGGLIAEMDLYNALTTNQLAGAALDVLSVEPPPVEHPLLHAPNCIVTPHNAWASRDARQRLLDETIANVAAFLQGKPRNVVNTIVNN
jgi:glycerate dehydrogenase